MSVAACQGVHHRRKQSRFNYKCMNVRELIKKNNPSRIYTGGRCLILMNIMVASTPMHDLTESVACPAQHRHWKATDLVWSIHRDNKELDRARKGTSSRFTHLPHTKLENVVYF